MPRCGDVANHDPPIVAESLHRGTRFDNNVLQGIQEDSLENAINTHTQKKTAIAVKITVSLCVNQGNHLNLHPVVCVRHMYELIHSLDHCRI